MAGKSVRPTGVLPGNNRTVGRNKPREVFVARIPPRARALVARGREGRISLRERETHNMKIGRVLRRVMLKGVMRAGNMKMLVSLASLGMLVMMFFCAREAVAQTTRPAGPNIVGPFRADPKVDGRFYVVDRFELAYLKQRRGQPPLSQVMQIEVELGRAQDGYVRPRPGLPTVRFRLANAPRQILDRYYTSAIDEIDKQIVRWFNSQGMLGVFV